MRVAILALCVAIAVGISLAMLYATWLHRRKRESGPHFHRRLVTEVAWAAVPCFMLLIGAIPAGRLILEPPVAPPAAIPPEHGGVPVGKTPERRAMPSHEERAGSRMNV